MAIQRADGMFTTLVDEVGEVFVQCYQALIGSLKATILIDVEVALIGPCLDDNSHTILLAPVSNAVIKEALYSNGNDKATDPDGYTSFFFKNSLAYGWK